jgi:hypothetical protein
VLPAQVNGKDSVAAGGLGVAEGAGSGAARRGAGNEVADVGGGGSRRQAAPRAVSLPGC